MSYPTRLQCIKRRSGWRQFYLNIPAALAEALDCDEGETWQWQILDRKRLVLRRGEDRHVPSIKKGK